MGALSRYISDLVSIVHSQLEFSSLWTSWSVACTHFVYIGSNFKTNFSMVMGRGLRPTHYKTSRQKEAQARKYTTVEVEESLQHKGNTSYFHIFYQHCSLEVV